MVPPDRSGAGSVLAPPAGAGSTRRVIRPESAVLSAGLLEGQRLLDSGRSAASRHCAGHFAETEPCAVGRVRDRGAMLHVRIAIPVPAQSGNPMPRRDLAAAWILMVALAGLAWVLPWPAPRHGHGTGNAVSTVTRPLSSSSTSTRSSRPIQGVHLSPEPRGHGPGTSGSRGVLQSKLVDMLKHSDHRLLLKVVDNGRRRLVGTGLRARLWPDPRHCAQLPLPPAAQGERCGPAGGRAHRAPACGSAAAAC
ncbi:hypothetical protein STSP_49540 [Streptomyces jeddahensis]|uniref:Uncharacterized protein n=1 Tax=Streptomyces jeddahensis TaxID=1716141 RepID=A0A177HLL4_9ACTN|nr:hypothetical protein STSP_49540 [Streptomyces jeddahensis]